MFRTAVVAALLVLSLGQECREITEQDLPAKIVSQDIGIWEMSYSALANLIARHSSDRLLIIDATTGRLAYHSHWQRFWHPPAISSDGSIVAVPGGWTNDVKVLDVLTEDLLHQLDGEIDFVRDAAISPDGRLLAIEKDTV